jgi:RHS repeat-associated protein
MTSDLQIYDRDLSGYAAAYHTAKYDSGVTVIGNHYSTLAGSGDQWMCCLGAPSLNGAFPPDGTAPSGSPIIKMIRTDGYQAGNLIFQGVRTYDPQAGQWTTPDHFFGNLTNPMSQYSYAWNGGNPITNSDPSGYVTMQGVLAGVAVAAIIGLIAAAFLPFEIGVGSALLGCSALKH